MKREGYQRGRLIALLLTALLAPAATHWVMGWLPSLHRLELLAYSWHCRSLPGLPADERIVLVGMDEASLDRLPLERRAYPLPRSIHARLVDELREADAAIVAFDIWFVRGAAKEDALFAEAIRRHGKVIGAARPLVRMQRGQEQVTFDPPPPLLRPWMIPASVLVPQPFGEVLWVDTWPRDATTGELYPHISVAAVACYLGEELRPPVDNHLQIGRLDVPLGDDGELLIRYAGPGGTFNPVPYYEVFSGEWKKKRGADFFRNKIVLVGAINPWADRHDTPLGNMPGVEIHANAIQTMLQGNWPRHWSVLENYLVTAALCLLAAASFWRLGLAAGLAATFGLALAWLLAAHQLFLRAGVWADAVEPQGAMAATFGLAAALEARRMRRVFRRFMPS
jgi:adenylate cyclase